MKKENNKKKVQKFREKYGTGEELDKQIETYASNPAQRERKKQYYLNIKESIKGTRQKRKDKVDAIKKAEIIAQSYERTKGLLDYSCNELDDKVRFRNKTLGQDRANASLKAGIKALSEKSLSDEAKAIISKFENDIESTYERFQSQIDDLKEQISNLKFPDFDEYKKNGCL